MIEFHLKLLCLCLSLLLISAFKPPAAQTQWPPYNLTTTFSHQEGFISYQLLFRQLAGIQLNDLTVKIPIPAGTRFVKADMPSDSPSNFNGKEVSFSTIALQRSWQISFTVEITDSTQTIFETQAWTSWVGEIPGTYLVKGIEADITRQPLPWQPPGRSRLQLETTATISGETVTYRLYPKNVNSLRMWDLRVSLPIPTETTFVSVEAPPQFAAGFDGQSAVFSIIEMPGWTTFDPFKVTVSISKALTTSLVTQAQAFWKNSGRPVGLTIPAEEIIKTSPLILQPGAEQLLVADSLGDAAFPFYDLSGVTITQEEEATKVTFHTAELAAVEEPLRYQFLIDQDCSAQSGEPYNQERGWDYRLIYQHQQQKAVLRTWAADQQEWIKKADLQSQASIESPAIAIWIPAGLLSDPSHFCWQALARYETTAYHPDPPRDTIPNSQQDFWLTQYQAITPLTTITNTSNSSAP